MSVQPVRHLFTADEYQRMGEAGLFGEDDRLELIEGEIVEMAPIGSRHAACVDRLTRLLTAQVGDRAIVRVQSPIRLSARSEPQPDVTLLAPRTDFYGEAHPGPGDVWLVVEVADTSGAWDREVKARLYARAGVPEMWVVDLDAEVVDVLRDPGPSGYAEMRRAGRGERLEAAGTVVEVDELLG
ncbi:MAG TPA: Uma2 family endonuclease [Acidimicrobiia bacterium]|nr:Uma2 family endonuclease [Acidimicrobiia bacterium]